MRFSAVFLLHAPAPTPYSAVFLLHAPAPVPAPIKIGCGLVRCGLVGCVGEAYTPTPELVTQFKPINLCNVTYKIISKVLVNRLKPLMNSLITPYENAFIQGRQIIDNIILTQKV